MIEEVWKEDDPFVYDYRLVHFMDWIIVLQSHSITPIQKLYCEGWVDTVMETLQWEKQFGDYTLSIELNKDSLHPIGYKAMDDSIYPILLVGVGSHCDN